MAINLVSKEDQSLKKIARLAAVFRMVSTVVLIVYLGGVGAMYWWWYTLIQQERIQSEEEKQLVVGLSRLGATEVVMRQLDLRSKTVDSKIKNRIEVAPKLGKLLVTIGTGIEVVDWTYGTEGSQTVTVQTANAIQVENLVSRVKDEYKTVKLARMTRRGDAMWEAKLIVSGGI